MSTIAVIGATGYVGGHITDEALLRGHAVIAASRTATQPRTGLIPRAGSIFDLGFVDALARDADVLVVAVPAAPGPDGKLADAVPSLLESADRHGTRLGVVGGAGSLLLPGGGRLIDSDQFPDEAKVEAGSAAQALEDLRSADSKADWFYLSPAAMFGAWVPGERTGAYRVGRDDLLTDADGTSAISGADYAIAFLDEIESPRHHRERFSVAY